MNNDLISRSELKKEFAKFDRIYIADTGNELVNAFAVDKLIDNAPTVEPFEPDYVGAERLKARQRGYEEGYHNGMEIGKTLNPKIKQGEWIDYSNEGYVECPFCGSATNCEDNKDELHYCWNCGAKMKGG